MLRRTTGMPLQTLSFFFVSALLSVQYAAVASASFTLPPLFAALVGPRTDQLEKVQPIPANPCVQACEGDGANSHACMQCCRTVQHEVDWKCGEESRTMFKASGARCCAGEWNPECWDTPSADNFFHACASCCGSCTVSGSGCGDCGNSDGGCACGGCNKDGVCTSDTSGSGPSDDDDGPVVGSGPSDDDDDAEEFVSSLKATCNGNIAKSAVFYLGNDKCSADSGIAFDCDGVAYSGWNGINNTATCCTIEAGSYTLGNGDSWTMKSLSVSLACTGGGSEGDRIIGSKNCSDVYGEVLDFVSGECIVTDDAGRITPSLVALVAFVFALRSL